MTRPVRMVHRQLFDIKISLHDGSCHLRLFRHRPTCHRAPYQSSLACGDACPSCRLVVKVFQGRSFGPLLDNSRKSQGVDRDMSPHHRTVAKTKSWNTNGSRGRDGSFGAFSTHIVNHHRPTIIRPWNTSNTSRLLHEEIVGYIHGQL